MPRERKICGAEDMSGHLLDTPPLPPPPPPPSGECQDARFDTCSVENTFYRENTFYKESARAPPYAGPLCGVIGVYRMCSSIENTFYSSPLCGVIGVY